MFVRESLVYVKAMNFNSLNWFFMFIFLLLCQS